MGKHSKKEILTVIILSAITLSLIICSSMLIMTPTVSATTEYKTGDLLFVIMTNTTTGQALKGANCTLTVINGTVTAYLNASMADANDGSYYWSIPAGLSAQPSVPYRAKAVCNMSGTGDWQAWTYFYVVDIHSPQRLFGINLTLYNMNITLNATPEGVWNYIPRTLTQNITQNDTFINTTLNASSVWDYPNRNSSYVSITNATQQYQIENATNVSKFIDAYNIWEYSGRNLTWNSINNATQAYQLENTTNGSAPVGATAIEVWEFGDRNLTWVSIDNATQQIEIENASAEYPVNLTQNAFDTIASMVWNYATRSLTTFGTLVADIWASASRTLTDFGTLVSNIWQNPSRNLTDFNETTVWEYGNRNLTWNSINNATQQAQMANATGSTTIVNDNSTMNIILPAEAIK